MATTSKPYRAQPVNMKPLPPTTPDDVRPSVCDLLSKHTKAIEEIKTLIDSEPLYNPLIHDDLWILRFWLSHKNSRGGLKHAVEVIISTMKYRKLHGLDDNDIRYSKWPDWDREPNEVEESAKFLKLIEKYAVFHFQPDPDRGIISLINASGLNMKTTIAETTEEEETLMLRIFTEWRFQVLDDVTRRTGRLTKHAQFVSLKGFRFAHFSKKGLERNTSIMKAAEDFYPQLNGGIFIRDAPKWFQLVWRMTRRLYPKRLLEKFDLITNLSDALHIFSKFLDIDHLPISYGGKSEKWPPPSGRKKAQT